MIGQPPASRFCKLGTALALVAMCAGFTGQVAAQTVNLGDTTAAPTDTSSAGVWNDGVNSINLGATTAAAPTVTDSNSTSTVNLGASTATQPDTSATTSTSGLSNLSTLNLTSTVPATATSTGATAAVGNYTTSNGTTTSGSGYSPTSSASPGCSSGTQSNLNGQASNALGNNATIINARMTKANPIWSGCNLQNIINMYDNLMSLFTGAGSFSLANLGDYIMTALVTAACNLVSTAVQGAVNTGLSYLGSTGVAGNIASNTLGGALYGGQQGAVNGLTNGVGNAISTVTGSTLSGTGISLTPTGILNQATTGSNSTLTGAVQGPSTQTVLQNLQTSLFGASTAPASSVTPNTPTSTDTSQSTTLRVPGALQ